MKKKPASILFLGKQNDEYSQKALEYCKERFETVSAHLGKWGDPLPQEARDWSGDYILSFLSRWVVPASLLQRAKIAAINFHPASPEYPGIGCNNFALYEEAKTYGSTCHFMASRVDTGGIIAVKRFAVLPEDDVEALLRRTYEHQLVLFYEVLELIYEGKTLKESGDQWTRKPFTREEFNALCKIRPDMSKEELSKRIRATTFGTWKPILELHGFNFELKL